MSIVKHWNKFPEVVDLNSIKDDELLP